MSKIITGSERNFGAERRKFWWFRMMVRWVVWFSRRQNRCQIEHKMCPASSKPDFFRLRRAGNQPKEIMKWLQTARRNRLKCELCESLMLIHARKFKCAISSYLEFGSNILKHFLMSVARWVGNRTDVQDRTRIGFSLWKYLVFENPHWLAVVQAWKDATGTRWRYKT